MSDIIHTSRLLNYLWVVTGALTYIHCTCPAKMDRRWSKKQGMEAYYGLFLGRSLTTFQIQLQEQGTCSMCFEQHKLTFSNHQAFLSSKTVDNVRFFDLTKNNGYSALKDMLIEDRSAEPAIAYWKTFLIISKSSNVTRKRGIFQMRNIQP